MIFLPLLYCVDFSVNWLLSEKDLEFSSEFNWLLIYLRVIVILVFLPQTYFELI